jgi:hypothetical protein
MKDLLFSTLLAIAFTSSLALSQQTTERPKATRKPPAEITEQSKLPPPMPPPTDRGETEQTTEQPKHKPDGGTTHTSKRKRAVNKAPDRPHDVTHQTTEEPKSRKPGTPSNQ